MARGSIRFGAIAKNAPHVSAWQEFARRVEGYGYSSLLVGDHIRNQWGPLVGLTSAAEATTSLVLGMNVLNNDFRNPVVLAQEIATLDVVSGGRVEVGLGAGYSPADYHATGIPLEPAATRVARLSEAVRIMKQFWGAGLVDFEGEFFAIRGAQGFPRTVSAPWPRLCIGGAGKRLLHLAAREADIVNISPSFARGALDRTSLERATTAAFKQKVDIVREAAGSRFDQLELHLSILWVGVGNRAARQMYALTREFGLSEAQVDDLPVALIGSEGQIREKVQRLHEELGVSYFSISDPFAFAPVVGRIAGQPFTFANVKAKARSRVGRVVRQAQARVRPAPAELSTTPVKHRVLMVGVGGMGEKWIRKYLPGFDERCEYAGLVDISPAALEAQGSFLSVPESRRFTSIERAAAAVDRGDLGSVDACFIVVPPAFHLEAIEAAAACGLDILCEKPIAESWDDCVAAAKAVYAAGVKAQIVQNYRYWPHIEAARQHLASGALGPLNYVAGRFAMDFRVRDSWGGAFRHRMRHAMLLEGSVHHLDTLRHLTGSNVRSLFAQDWRPPTATGFDGECCALVTGEFADGARFVYEGSVVAAGSQDPWGEESYRLECAEGALVVSNKAVQIARTTIRGVTHEPMPGARLAYRGHEAVIAKFFDWREGGPLPETHIGDNLETAAAMIAAVESSETGQRVDLSRFLTAL